jgi:RNA polymerase sigma factor (sigma-70 family)
MVALWHPSCYYHYRSSFQNLMTYQLVTDALAGDEQAIAKVRNDISKLIRGRKNYTVNRDDLIQWCFIQLYQIHKNYKPERKDFDVYARKCLVRWIYKQYNRYCTPISIPYRLCNALPNWHDPIHFGDESFLARSFSFADPLINDALSTLDQKKRRILILKYLYNCEVKEIAEMEGCTSEAIRMQIKRCKK